MITNVDYGVGNIKRMANMFHAIGAWNWLTVRSVIEPGVNSGHRAVVTTAVQERWVVGASSMLLRKTRIIHEATQRSKFQ